VWRISCSIGHLSIDSAQGDQLQASGTASFGVNTSQQQQEQEQERMLEEWETQLDALDMRAAATCAALSAWVRLQAAATRRRQRASSSNRVAVDNVTALRTGAASAPSFQEEALGANTSTVQDGVTAMPRTCRMP
jgi:hypothetical protein